MSESTLNPDPSASAAATSSDKPAGLSRRWLLGILALSFLFVLMPFLFWRATWFGQPLTDHQITRNLADREHPRKAQHALSQIADRLVSRDAAVRASARPWYPQIVALAGSDHPQLRLTAAWVMGQDNRYVEFQEALRRLVADPDPMVRRNAALSLVRFGDDSGHAVIHGLLEPYIEKAPTGGTFRERLKPGDTVNPGTLLARIETPPGKVEVRSHVPGTLTSWLVSDGAAVSPGNAIASIEPSAEEQWEALRALYIIGNADDLPLVEGLARNRAETADSVRRQAELTARAIRQRSTL